MGHGEELAGLAAHLAERHERLRRQFAGRHPVDDVDDRDALSADLEHEVVETVIGNRADHDGIGAGGHAVLDLADLRVELGVAARLDQLHVDPQPVGLGGDSVVHAQPVGILHVRERTRRFPSPGWRSPVARSRWTCVDSPCRRAGPSSPRRRDTRRLPPGRPPPTGSRLMPPKGDALEWSSLLTPWFKAPCTGALLARWIAKRSPGILSRVSFP